MNDMTVQTALLQHDNNEVDRATFIGGSDAAAILGISKWSTPLQVFYEKTRSPLFQKKDKAVFQRGKRWEPIALEMLLDALEDEDGVRPELVARNARYTDPDYPFLSCEIDAEIMRKGERVNVEIKTVHPFAAGEWGEQGSEEIPITYAAQVMHGMGIRKSQRVIVGALFGADNMLPFVVERDDETIRAMRDKSIDFWNNHVLTGIAPDPLNMADMMLLLTKRNGKPVELSQAIADRVFEVQHIRNEIKMLDEQKEVCEFEIFDAVRAAWDVDAAEPADLPSDNAILRLNGIDIASWKRQRRAGIDSKRLKKERPDIAQLYLSESFFRVLRLKK